ncbi:hypothetical protein [Methylovorus sp. MM2]|nr:hypothetical protein [Methylovorus sp. MM2]
MNYRDHLVMRARSFWGNDEQLPLELFAEMNAEGIDIDAEENKFYNTNAD